MVRYGSYVVCHEYLNEVREFLLGFFEEENGKYNFVEWITFKVPHLEFLVNLMKGDDQPLTQNMTFELYCQSKAELINFAAKHKASVKDFVEARAPQKYRYHYSEILGPQNICKVEINFIEDID